MTDYAKLDTIGKLRYHVRREILATQPHLFGDALAIIVDATIIAKLRIAKRTAK